MDVRKTRDGVQTSNFPSQCPRCQNWCKFEDDGSVGREIIEPLRTKGPQSFAAIVEDGFRVQPRARHGRGPNHGRKALLFTDSRQDAAILAADLRKHHQDDLFRQLLYHALYACNRCGGRGSVIEKEPYRIGQPRLERAVPCPDCQSSGGNSTPTPLAFEEIRNRVIRFQEDREIDPSPGSEELMRKVGWGPRRS